MGGVPTLRKNSINPEIIGKNSQFLAKKTMKRQTRFPKNPEQNATLIYGLPLARVIQGQLFQKTQTQHNNGRFLPMTTHVPSPNEGKKDCFGEVSKRRCDAKNEKKVV